MAYKSRFQQLGEKKVQTTPTATDSTKVYTTLEYPNNSLGGDKYPHYVIFYINENEKSKIAIESGDFFKSNEQPKVVVKTAGSSTSKVLSGNAQGTTDASVKTTDVGFGTAVVHKVLDALSGTLKEFTSSKKRIKVAMCLPMPQTVKANYSANYAETEELGALGATIMAAISKDGDATQTALLGLAPVAVGMVTEGAKSIMAMGTGKKIADGVIGKGLSPQAVSQLASKLSGRVINKRQEQLFSNMAFRTHQFQYLFIPRNKDESAQIEAIIKKFKIHMHPELNEGQGSSLLITPAEFDIEFRFGDEENLKLSKIATCALKVLDVNYTAIGEFIAFEGTPNPVAISLDMTFVEMEPINRNMIHLGY